MELGYILGFGYQIIKKIVEERLWMNLEEFFKEYIEKNFNFWILVDLDYFCLL